MAMETLANNGLADTVIKHRVVRSVWSTPVAEAENDEVPDMEFLEYLGLWEETDEDWLLLEDEEDGRQ